MNKLAIIGGAVVAGAVGFLFTGWLILVLWNFLFPALFHFPVIGYGQALALGAVLVLVGSFFKK